MVASLLGGCSGDPGNSNAESKPSTKLAQLVLPEAYDTKRGWDAKLDWVSKHATTLPIAVVPSGGVGLLDKSPDGYSVQLRDAATGKIRWSARPWTPPPADTDADEEHPPAIPELFAVEQDGQQYLVASARGVKGKDELHHGEAVVQLAVYAADSQGNAVAPLREISLPDAGVSHYMGDGHRLLVTNGSYQNGPHGTDAAIVDLVTGKVTERENAFIDMRVCPPGRSCNGAVYVGISEDGLVLANNNGGGFTVLDKWTSPDVTPEGFDRQEKDGNTDYNGRAYSVVDTHILTMWRGSQGPTWMLQDTATGRVDMKAQCVSYAEESLWTWEDHIVVSPNGRYVIAGPVAFDREQKKGFCLDWDRDRKGVSLTSVIDNGMAYGIIEESDPQVLVQVPLDTAEPKVLSPNTVLPLMQGDGYGLVTRHDPGDPLQIFVRPLRSSADK
ncbi:hypothetical protein ACH4U5_37810 [Streptomyces sp. NPDC020858]|uniref:hypothetical protein n=1 Tax=Streptomyces sp. NPDC020858 TaxID=3365097 RepID=UPI0037A01EB4